MKDFKEYLVESAKQYEFRIKIAGECTDEQCESFERAFDEYGLVSLSKPKISPIQKDLVDFPLVHNCEVTIMNLVVDYPVTPQELVVHIKTICGIDDSRVKVETEHMATIGDEIADEEEVDEEYEVLLTSDYKDAGNEKDWHTDVVVDKVIKDHVTRKMEYVAKPPKAPLTTNDLPQGKVSPIGSIKTTHRDYKK